MRFLAYMLLTAVFAVGCSTETLPESAEFTTNTNVAETETSDKVTEADSDAFVIDVRSKAEWDTGHVEQAAHIPHTEIAARIAEVTDRKDARIVLYCAVGGRAGKAKKSLEDIGFTNVENAGGYDDVKDRFE